MYCESGSSDMGMSIKSRSGSQKAVERMENPSGAEPLLTPPTLYFGTRLSGNVHPRN